VSRRLRPAARRFAAAIVALACAAVVANLSAAPAGQPDGGPASPQLRTAADASTFRAGNIISDAVFYDSQAMTASQIQTFLDDKGSSCRQASGYLPCLKDYQISSSSQAPDSFCPNGYTGAANETAAEIIAKVAVACGISPRVLLVSLQKETGLLTRSGTSLTQHIYDRAMGYGCADSMNGGCLAYYPGLFKQLYFAAKQFQRYRANPTHYNFIPGIHNNIPWSTNAACGSGSVLIENQATAGLYDYTPYQPNAAALAAGYGTGDGCSQYGNRNFWMYFTDWFGSTQVSDHDVDAPVGNFESATGNPGSIDVSGWTFDPSLPTQSIDVHVYVDGRIAGLLHATGARRDVGSVFPAAGAAHGFSGTVLADQGTRTVCVYGINVGAGYSNPLLGCRTVQVQSGAAQNPAGNFESLTALGSLVQLNGWSFDPDEPTQPVTVHVYVDGRWYARVTADGLRGDVGRAFPQAGASHGFGYQTMLPLGQHTVCVYAINVDIGTTNPLLGCRAITLVGAQPVGALQRTTLAAGTVRLQGYAIDPDTTGAVSVHVYVNGRWRMRADAAVARPDVGAVYAALGDRHGFDISVPLGAGQNQVCVYAINADAGSGNPLLGCDTVNVVVHDPVGNFERATVSGTTVTVSGWALDEDVATQPLSVHLYVDGRWTARVLADANRADVGRVYPDAGAAHGWAGTLTLPSGPHQVCAYAINAGGGTVNPLLLCRNVTVP
jgi:hypothetical protein